MKGSKTLMFTLSKLPKSSSFAAKLLPDPDISLTQVALKNDNNVIHKPRILQTGDFSYTLPEERKTYKYLTSSDTALKDLGLTSEEVESQEYQDIVSGKAYQDPKFVDKYPFPYSMAYAGFQFGQFAGQLGDGRVVNLFEVPKNKKDNTKTRNKYELQLKGAGMTPYSRFADGKAVLRSSIREYIISEHLNSIGVPTTRALSLVYLPDTLARRYLPERCAIVARFAESWIRIGTFDLHRYRGDLEGLKKLCDYCIEELFTVDGVKFPWLTEISNSNASLLSDVGELTDYQKLYFEIIIRNALGTAKWQTFGILNGVLNTDNTSILGLSMDYGPFSIMDKFKPDYTPNSEDHSARYSYSNTPTAIWWNLTRLGEDMAAILHGEEIMTSQPESQAEEQAVKQITKIIEVGRSLYMHCYTKKYVESFYERLGLSPELVDGSNPNEQNSNVITPLLKALEKIECDFNYFFVDLQQLDFDSKTMDIDAIAEKLTPKTHDYLSVEDMQDYLKEWLPKYKEELVKSEKIGYSRGEAKKYNPLFLPRNWILDEVIEDTTESKAEDISLLKKLEKMSFHPFDKSKWGDELKDVEERWTSTDIEDRYTMQQCSCSS